MRHQRAVRKLGKTTSHRRAMLRNMVTSLLRHERIRTTTPKAKVARRYVDRMITLGKRGDLHARRTAARFINDETVLKKLFDEIAPKFAERNGGYTRIMRDGIRKGDASGLGRLSDICGSLELFAPRFRCRDRHPATTGKPSFCVLPSTRSRSITRQASHGRQWRDERRAL